MANARRADSRRMANQDANTDTDESSDEVRSLTKRMLDLIHRFDAEERRSGTTSDHADPEPGQGRRRDDMPTPTSTSADDLIVESARSD